MFKKILAIAALLFAGVSFAAVDANKATPAELDGVKGIGPVTSQLIISERKKGDFKNWDDFVTRVKGVGDSRAAKLSAQGLTVDGATYKGPATASKPMTEKVKDGTKTAVEKTKEAGKTVATKTKEVAVEAKDKVTGK